MTDDELNRLDALAPVAAIDLGWAETDGAVSINADAVAKRLNDLLAEVRRLRGLIQSQQDAS